MSWDAYCGPFMQTGAEGSLLAEMGSGSLWASLGNLKSAQASEIVELGTAISGLEEDREKILKQLTTSGVVLGGQRYVFVKAGARSIYAKRGLGGVLIACTGRLLFAVVYPQGVWPHQLSHLLARQVAYLDQAGY